MSPRLSEGRRLGRRRTIFVGRTWYFFGDNNRSGWTAIFGAYRQPAYFTQHELLSGKEATLSFGIGASG